MRKTKDKQQAPNVHIAVENFGPIEKAEIDLRPLTVFVGESNTRKTYLSALVYALYRTFEGFSRVPWLQDVILLLKEIDTETLEAQEKLTHNEQAFRFSDLPQWQHADILRGLSNPEPLGAELKRCSISTLFQS